jgi:hypothetical protein
MENILQTALDELIAERGKLPDIDALILARDQMDTQIAQLKGILDPTPAKPAKVKGKRNLSPEARKSISDGQKRRWQKAGQVEAPAVAPVE